MAGDIKVTRSGARIVELLMPFEYDGMKIDAVTLGPFVLEHTLKWRKAGYKDWFELMVSVATINGRSASSEAIGQLRYPDADRVAENFVEILPVEIREAQTAGMWPRLETMSRKAEEEAIQQERNEVDANAPAVDSLNIDD